MQATSSSPQGGCEMFYLPEYVKTYNHTERQAERQAERQVPRSHSNALWHSKMGPGSIPKRHDKRQDFKTAAWRSVCLYP